MTAAPAVRTYAHWRDVPASAWRWPSFSPEEIACRGTGRLVIDEDVLDRLQALRTRIGKPIIIRSAYRSPEHNKAIGGEPNSQHLKGRAFDVAMANHDPAEFERLARAVGFTGFGFYPRPAQDFMHIDTGPMRTWGDPFPPETPKFSPEPPPARETLAGSRTMQGAGMAGVATTASAVVAAAPVIDAVRTQLEPFADAIPWVKTALFGLVLLGIGVMVYARLDDWLKGKR